jgi:predicted nucleotide-binding protein (sugar kinase/HSP70/actin superfamily)
MGYMSAPIAHMLENLNIQVIKTPPITKKTVALGALHSPEGVCLPYKITMGNFIEATEQGADTVVSMCGAGKCRFGFFGAVQKEELAKRQAVNFHTLDTEHLLRDLYRFLRQAAPAASSLAVVRNIALALKKLQALDTINDAKNRYGARALNADKIIDLCTYGAGEIAAGEDFAEVKYTRDIILQVMASHISPPQTTPPKIALVGEFYVLLEPYVNHWIENALVRQGIEVKKFVYTGNWAYSKILLQTLGLYNEEKEYLAQARPYFNHHVGGDGLKSVGTSVWSAKNGYDGIIHVFPFGCMPEVVAQYAMKNVCSDYRLPLLSLSVDEHSSDVGITTRVEAFADCIKRRKTEKGKA